MKNAILFFVITAIVISFSPDARAAHAHSEQAKNVEDFRPGTVDYKNAALKDAVKQSGKKSKALRQQQAYERKMQRVSKLFGKLHAKAAAGDTSGIGLALLIILIGAALALLGLVGIADLLITIGIIVFAVGLIIWLVTAVS